MKQRETDVAVIGAGTAGLIAYRAARTAGSRAVLIEGGPYGTTCARVGCMPSKLLIAAAEAAHMASISDKFGVHVSGVRVDGKQVMDRVRSERDRFVGFVLESVENIPEEDRIRGNARFVSDTVLRIDDHTELKARSIVIATGSSPVVPEMYKALGDRAIINDDVFEWRDLPKSIFIVGAGVIGLELGQALARLGVKVQVAARSRRIGGLADESVANSALEAFREEFSICLETEVLEVGLEGEGVRVRYRTEGGTERVENYDYVLLAAGRRPNLASLGLENTGAVLDEKNMPEFDHDTLQLGELPLFIAGDVNGVLPILHEAADDGHIAGSNAAAWPDAEPGTRRAPMAVVFTEPQLAQVGARLKDLPRKSTVCGEVSFGNQGRSRIMLKNRGKLRVYADRADGRFLGAEMAGPSMEHIAHLLAWSLQQGLTVGQMMQMPFYHPTVEEGLRTALRQAARRQVEADLDYVRECEEAVNKE